MRLDIDTITTFNMKRAGAAAERESFHFDEKNV